VANPTFPTGLQLKTGFQLKIEQVR